MSTDQLQFRLDRLERRQSLMLRAGSALAVVIGSAALMAQVEIVPPVVPPGMQSVPIKASSFALVDRDGKTRAVLRMEGGEPVLSFQDARGGPALRLAVRGSRGVIEYSDGSEVLSLMEPAHRLSPLTTR
jgi:hypothetical protein